MKKNISGYTLVRQMRFPLFPVFPKTFIFNMRPPWIKRSMSNLAQWLHSEGSELKEGITSLVRDCLTGLWYTANSSNISIKKIRGGLSNSVFKVTLSKINQNNFKNDPGAVIMRFHEPSNFDSIFEHVSESLAFMFLSEKKFGPKLYAIFPGGRIEEYIDARPLTTKELGECKFSIAIAEKLALFHSFNPPLSRRKGIMFDTMEKWLKQIKKESFCWKTDSSETLKCIEFFKELDLTKEISWIRKYLEEVNSPIMFCHNDVQEGNILVKHDSENSEKPEITLIDYEYSFYNYEAFELANHFLEYTMCYEQTNYPNFVVNEDDYPSQNQQLLFIRRYLTVKEHLQTDKHNREIPLNLLHDSILHNVKASSGEITEEEFRFLDEISKFQLASHLFWGIWAALRSQSHINFSYWEYCYARLKSYYKLKELKG